MKIKFIVRERKIFGTYGSDVWPHIPRQGEYINLIKRKESNPKIKQSIKGYVLGVRYTQELDEENIVQILIGTVIIEEPVVLIKSEV